MIRRLLLLAMMFVAPAAFGESTDDGAAWLSRMMNAARTLSYSGTFVYQTGNQSETSRVVRIVDASGERERLEVLDGSPREVVRVNDEVRCYLPDDKRVIVERRSAQRSFPALLSGMGKRIEEYYTVRIGDVDRIAGVEARQIRLEPRDNWRFGYRLWADITSGLLIKARTVDEKGGLLEQFAFTQFSLGIPADADATASRMQGQSTGWRVEQRDVTVEATRNDLAWKMRQTVPGFIKAAQSGRRIRDSEPEVTHLVFSDGLAAISLFIGVADQTPIKPAMSRQGAVNMYSRRLGDLKVTAVGEVPMATVRRFVESVELNRP